MHKIKINPNKSLKAMMIGVYYAYIFVKEIYMYGYTTFFSENFY